ncbi:MAG TPA: undecaprenyl/decaprenyl-phosphate alpha-N-acetylglucosaminyl 1-phosphate transferase, partial [Gammaproteobacteria bacterium]|nr:undecaprenyl/decaprenyl-phosphate alpha-N-acetylglucosaminyl 1-phosphate transferase [Gammaproteobacteria bacterium]
MITFAGFIVSMMLTMVLMPLAKQMGYRFHIVDVPNQRKVHAIPIPRIGGLAIVMGAAAPLMIWLDLSRSVKGYLAGALVILVFGILDDRFELGYKLKFGAQFLAAVLAVVYGGVHFEQLHIFHHWMPFPEPFAIAVTCFFILAAVNAINFSDGLDGLAGGVVLISL